MTRPTSKPKGTTRRMFFRCEWCGAGGSIQVPEYEQELDTAWAAKKLLEEAHERSPMCHTLRWLSQVRTSDKAIPK